MNYTVKKIDEDLWAIEEEMVRCFLFGGTENAILLDACASGGEAFTQAVWSALPAENKQVSVVLSHADPDHVAGVSSLGSPAMHPAEFERFRTVVRRDKIENLHPLWESDTLAAKGGELAVLHIPGHTPGSIALIDRENKRAFAGDTISLAPIYMFGPGRCLEAYIESLKKLDEKTGGIDFFYACHGEIKVPREQLGIQIRGAEKLLAGELKAEGAMKDLPCKLYRFESCAFLY